MNRHHKKSSVANTSAPAAKTKSLAGRSLQSGLRSLFAYLENRVTSRKLSKMMAKSSLFSVGNSSVSKSSKKVTSHKAKLKNTNLATRNAASWWFLVYALVITIGLSTIFGTGFSVINSWHEADPKPAPKAVAKPNKTQLDNLLSIASLGREIAPLKAELQQLKTAYPNLSPHIFIVDLDTKGFVSFQSKEVIPSASTIKLPILVALFQEVDRGRIGLDEQLVMKPELIAKEAGDMQHQPPGSKFSALKVAEKMIVISDNTATNMLIERLGGKERLNQQFTKMGLKNTQLNNPLPDLAGTNITTAEDLANLLVKIDQGKLLSLRSRDRLLQIMRRVKKDILLPQGLESGALIAHKTGELKSILADVGMIDMLNGKRYIAAMLVQRPNNSVQAQKFIQQASRKAYQYFKRPNPADLSTER